MSTYVRPASKYILLVLVNNTGVSQRGDRDDVCVSQSLFYEVQVEGFRRDTVHTVHGSSNILYHELL